jgi:hypothetical protein
VCYYRRENRMDWSMVRAFYGRDTRVIQTVPSQTWLALEEDSISPAWCPRFFASIVVIGVNIKLVCGGESNRMLRIISEGYPFHHLLTAHYERDITQLYCVCMYIYVYIYSYIYIAIYIHTHLCRCLHFKVQLDTKITCRS